MGVIFADESPPCENCGRYRCGLCAWLGDRSLIWVFRALRASESDAERQEVLRRFDAARGRSLQWPQVQRLIAEGKPLPPGILQRERERGKQ